MNAREVLVGIGRAAATGSEGWKLALDLNAEQLEYMGKRGAGELELALTRISVYSALGRLGRYRECDELLQDCRGVFEERHHIEGLGIVCGALADLQDETGDPETAVTSIPRVLRASVSKYRVPSAFSPLHSEAFRVWCRE